MTDLKDLPFREQLAAVAQMKRSGTWQPELYAPPPRTETERDAEGRELLEHAAMRWFGTMMETMVRYGIIVKWSAEGDPITLRVKFPSGKVGTFPIPNEALNARDTRYILKQFVNPDRIPRIWAAGSGGV